MNCIQPVNWKYCYRVDQWLVPEVVEGYKIWSGETHPYFSEKEYLNSVNSNSSQGHTTHIRGSDVQGTTPQY